MTWGAGMPPKLIKKDLCITSLLALLSYSLDKLFATVQTIFVSFTSSFCVFLLSTPSKLDVFIYYLATHRAKANRGV